MKAYAQELLEQSNILGLDFNEYDIREIMQAQNHQENREFTDGEYFNPFHDD